MSGGFGLPRLDFSPLSELGKTAAQGIREADQRAAVAGISAAPGSPSFLQQLGQTLLKQGDVNGALAASRLIEANQDRQYQRSTDSRNFDFQKSQAERQQANQDRSFGLQSDTSKYDRIYRDRALTIQEQAASRKELPEGFQSDPATPGAVRPIPGGPKAPEYIGSVKAAEEAAKGGNTVNPYATSDQKFNADQGKSAGFADRMFQNEQTIQAQEQQGTSRYQQGLSKAPFGLGSFGNSDEFKAYRSAKDNWIAAQLRKESGAAIGASEYDAADKQYFPQPGDPPALLQQKRQLRRLATEGMAREGGGSYQPRMIYGEGDTLKPYTPPERGARGAGEPQAKRTVDSLDAVPEGARFRAPDGRVYRKTNGQAVPE